MDKRKLLTKSIVVWAIALICCILWGSAFPMIKIGYRVLNIDSADTSTIILFAGVRFFVAGLLTVVIFSAFNKQLLVPKNFQSLKNIATLSMFQTILQYLFFYLGLAFTTGVNASVINGSSVFVALIISCLIFKQEKLMPYKVIGCSLGFVGACIAGLVGVNNRISLNIGDLFIFLSAISYSFSSAFMKKYSVSDNPAMLSGYQFLFGGLVMILIGFLCGGRFNANLKGALVIIYLAFVSAIAYSLWSILLKYNDVSKIAVCGSMTPIAGFVLSYLMLKENNGSMLFNCFGLVLVVVGILVVNKKKKEAKPLL